MAVPAIRLAVFSATAAALVSGVVGCSSSDSKPSPSASSSTTSAASSATSTEAGPPPGGDAFAQCLTEHGVPAPPQGGPHGPGPDGHGPHEGHHGPPPNGEHGTPPAPPGVDQNTWDTAQQACSSLAPTPPPAG